MENDSRFGNLRVGLVTDCFAAPGDAADIVSATHDFLAFVVSDFHGLNENSERALLTISQHNDLIAALVHDPTASRLPKSHDYVITDGELQIEVPNKGTTLQRVHRTSVGRIKKVLGLQTKLQCPVMPISTAEPVINQIQRLLGRRL